jgi:uncharacterized protein (UPF0261 family)
MVNFGSRESVPEKFAGRNFYIHNPQVTLMRTTAAECEELGKILAEKANSYTGPVEIFIPLQAISIISAPGQPFHDEEADHALFDAITRHAKVPVEIMNETINSSAFSQTCALRLLELVKERAPRP